MADVSIFAKRQYDWLTTAEKLNTTSTSFKTNTRGNAAWLNITINGDDTTFFLEGLSSDETDTFIAQVGEAFDEYKEWSDKRKADRLDDDA